MLRTNLSTRPFYNERVVHVALALIALAVLAVAAYNASRIVSLSRENTELSSRAAQDQAEAERLGREAAKVRRTINADELERVAYAAREANELIEHRTFSWTAFFNHIEATLPPDVMLVSVRPSVKDEQTLVSMTVLSRRTEDIDEFVEKLEATGAFEDVLPAQSGSTNEGLQRAVLESVYTGTAAEPEPSDASPAAPAGSSKPERGTPDAPASAPDTSKPGAVKSRGGRS